MCRRLRDQFNIGESDIEALVARTRALHDASVGVHQYTQLINQTLTPSDKENLLETMWRLASVDGQIDPLEEHAIRRIADLLYVSHSVFIATKLAARE